MTPDFYRGIYPVVTIKEDRRVRRFVCTSVRITTREGCIVLRFDLLDSDAVEFWGNRYHTELPSLDYFRENDAATLARKHDLPACVVEEFKRVIEFFQTPLVRETLLPEKKVL